jgi:tetratricopeptide (TPR) repeat protein
MLGYTYALSGRRGEAEGVLAKLQALARDQYVSPYRFAMIYTALGEKDQAFEWLNRACDESDFLVIYAGVSPFTDPLRGDPRFTEVLRRLRLAP